MLFSIQVVFVFVFGDDWCPGHTFHYMLIWIEVACVSNDLLFWLYDCYKFDWCCHKPVFYLKFINRMVWVDDILFSIENLMVD